MMVETDNRPAKMALWQGYLQTYATIIGLLEAELQQELNLPLLWYDTLKHLNTSPYGSLRLQDLADAINLSQSGLTRLLDRMTEANLVERRPCPEDRRGLNAAITDVGRAKLEQATPVYLSVLDRHFLRYLSCDEVNALLKVFSNIAQMQNQAAGRVEAD
ncbi:MAG: MarR family transcriptional regulator [Chloroflexi bacterium]|nr:MarR family transcriptional regulator [Chloroflexota bacterium]